MLFGASMPATTQLAGDMPALVLAGLLYVGAALAVLPAAALRRPSGAALRRSWVPLFGAVVAGGAVGPVILVVGLASAPAATASLLLNFELVATVVLAALFFREHLGGRVVGGAAAIVAASFLLVWQPGAELTTGALLVVAACVCWGLDNNLTAQIDQVAPEHVTLLKGAVAGTANIALGLVIAPTAGVDVYDITGALLIGALGYGVSITLWVGGARDLGAARAQAIFSVAPFVGAVIAWVVLGDPVKWFQIMATVIAAGGVWFSLDSAHEHEHAHVPMRHDHEHSHEDGHHLHRHHDEFSSRHSHPHAHEALVHAHAHLPDLHHRHEH
jgi:drug/metabolite transporter (DMT)-like permease